MSDRFTDYDPFAWIYNTHWGESYHSQSLPVMQRVLLSELVPGAHILDLCCGVGHLTEKLVSTGFRVTGIEGSAEMLKYAQERVPNARLLLGDARSFELEEPVDAVVSTFDSLNHVMTSEELRSVFQRIFAVLRPGGQLVFDVNREEAYRHLWVRSSPMVEANIVQIARGSYDEDERIARCDITLFRSDSGWHRSDFSLRQKCHTHEEISAALTEAGFAEIRHFNAGPDLAMAGEIAYGRSFYKAAKL